MKKIILKYKDKLYLFASFKRGSSDGSFYWKFERNSKSQTRYQYNLNNGIPDIHEIENKKDKKIKISYHPTGCIHYKATSNKFIYSESLLDIHHNFCFAFYSIPSVDKLDTISNRNAKSCIIIDLCTDIQFNHRTTFSLTIAPNNSNEIGFSKIDYISEGFTVILNIENFSFIHLNCIKNSFVFMAPESSLQNLQTFIPTRDFIQNNKSYNEQWALIKYHQKVNSTMNLIIYDQDNENRYRVVFSVPMRIPPRIEIVFNNPLYSIKCEECEHTYLLFKVIDGDGNVVNDSNLVQIVNIILNAQL